MPYTSDRLKTLPGQISRTPTYSLSDLLVRISVLLESEPDLKEQEVPLSATQLKQFGISNLTFLSGKMLKEVLFTKHRADLWAILKAFADIGNYRLEWQLLNTKWFLPQSRERIYLVGRRTGQCAGNIFPIGEEYCQDDKTKYNKNSCFGTIIRSYGGRPTMADYILEIPRGQSCQSPFSAEQLKKARMLTPVECERLQGFEDDFTRWGNYNGKIQPLSLRQRYNLLGNAVSVPTVQAVATRIRDNTILR